MCKKEVSASFNLERHTRTCVYVAGPESLAFGTCLSKGLPLHIPSFPAELRQGSQQESQLRGRRIVNIGIQNRVTTRHSRERRGHYQSSEHSHVVLCDLYVFLGWSSNHLLSMLSWEEHTSVGLQQHLTKSGLARPIWR